MALDDQEKLRDLERQKLLEEIRKRAEEAELKRIEEEEQKANLVTTPAPAEPEPPPDLTPPPPPPSRAPEFPQVELKVRELKEKLSIAIDRGKLDKANELLQELSSLGVDDDEVESLREQIHQLRRKQQEEAKAKKRAMEQKAREEAAQARTQREAQQKKISGLIEKANAYYQSEKYEKGVECLNEIFAMDPEHDEAKQLAASITKAKELADRVREEEARRRAEEAAVAPAPQPVAPPPSAGDVWGSREVVRAEDELGLPAVAEGPASLPKLPLLERIVAQISKIHIPVKPVLIGIGVVAVATSAYFIAASLKQAVFPPKYSLLVLPALSASVDSSTQFLADAVTEDLISAVASVGELRVIAAPTALSLRTYAGNFSQVARSLGANYFLQWNMLKNEDRVAFQVTLFDTLSAKPVWSAQTQNSMREFQSALREIGRTTVREMKVQTTPQEEELLARVSHTAPEAYEAYARGRWYLRQPDPSAVPSALSAFSSALEKDSLFVEAYIGGAWAHLMAVDRETDTLISHVQSAWRYLNRALSLGARSSESYRVRGLIAQYQLQYDRAVDELERGAVFAPSDAETQRRLAVAYAIKGRIDDALKVAAKAAADDPRNADSYTTLGSIQHLRDENLRLQEKNDDSVYREALQSFEQGMRYASDKSKYASAGYADLLEYTHQPERAAQILVDRVAQTQHYVDYYKLGRIYQTAGRPKQQWESTLQRAKIVLEETIAANPLDAYAYSYLALTETRLGAFKNAIEASTRARQLAPFDLNVLYNTARMFALQTDRTQALEYLSKAVDQRYRLSSILDMDFYNLRSDPEFQKAVTR